MPMCAALNLKRIVPKSWKKPGISFLMSLMTVLVSSFFLKQNLSGLVMPFFPAQKIVELSEMWKPRVGNKEIGQDCSLESSESEVEMLRQNPALLVPGFGLSPLHPPTAACSSAL